MKPILESRFQKLYEPIICLLEFSLDQRVLSILDYKLTFEAAPPNPSLRSFSSLVAVSTTLISKIG